MRISTIPLSIVQMETDQIAKNLMKPLEDKINKKYANNGKKKRMLLDELNRATENIKKSQGHVIKRIIASSIQMSLFSLFKQALSNLLRDEKLHESFLWIPSLDGSLFDKTTKKSAISYMVLPLLIGIVQFYSRMSNTSKFRGDVEEKRFEQGLEVLFSVVLPLSATISYLQQPAVMSLFWLINSLAAAAITMYLGGGHLFDLPIFSIFPEFSRIKQSIENDSEDL